MAYRFVQQDSVTARWSSRVALISLQLLILTSLLHRFASLHTPSALNLFLIGLLGGALSLILASWGLVRIWNKGFAGASSAIGGIFVAILIFAYPASQIPKFFTLPTINDITTDRNSPPSFEELASARAPDANSVIYPGKRFAGEQELAYPYIQPMILERSSRQAFELVQEAIQRLKWNIVSSTRPGRNGSPGRIEATDKTLLLGFVDDIAIRIAGDDSRARIDVRSASRYGQHDFGRNASRIRGLFTEIKTTLATGEALTKRLRKMKVKKRKTRSQEAESPRNEPARARSGTPSGRGRRGRSRRSTHDQILDKLFPQFGE